MYSKQHLRFVIVITKNRLQNKDHLNKGYRIIQRVLENKTKERNTYHKVTNINEMNNQYEIRSHDGTIHETKELKSLVVVGTETSMNLKTAIQKTDIININLITYLKIPLHYPDFVKTYNLFRLYFLRLLAAYIHIDT